MQEMYKTSHRAAVNDIKTRLAPFSLIEQQRILEDINMDFSSTLTDINNIAREDIENINIVRERNRLSAEVVRVRSYPI